MAVAISAPPALSGELSLFHTTDPLLSNSPVLVFHGPAATIGATSSRIQVHIFTPAGCGSYPRLAVSPNSPFYTAVSNLPREEQGDEVVRGLAFGLKKYFSELSEGLRKRWCTEAKAPSPSTLFGDAHIAILASRMKSVENVDEVIGDIARAFGEQRLSWLDMDVVLPSGSIREPSHHSNPEDDDSQALVQRYGRYAELVDSLGDVAFLPTSKLKRAPSKPSAIGRSASFLKSQRENVRKELVELLTTEESYVERLDELLTLSKNVPGDLDAAARDQYQKIFQPTIRKLVQLNESFLTGLRTIMQATEKAAIEDVESMVDDEPTALRDRQDLAGDTQGVREVAKYLSDWFPKFTDDYREYIDGHAQSAKVLREVLRDANSTLAPTLQEVGEQKLSSLLIEPVQRLPRYNLYIDSISKQLPVRHPATKILLSARDIITEICDNEDMTTAAATTIRKLQSKVSSWPSESPVSGRLVTAADYTEIVPPYSANGCEAEQGVLFLFTDGIVLLQKQGSGTTSARTLLTEIEVGQAPARQFPVRPTTPHDLRFLRTVPIDSIDCLEMLNGEALQIMISSKTEGSSSHTHRVDVCQLLRLEGFYERKAERLSEEITKAKVEGRFSELERESSKWEARASDPSADTASVFSAIFEDSKPDFVKKRSSRAPIRIIVDIDRHTYRPRAGQDGIRTVVSVSPLRDGLWRLAIDSVNGSVGREHLPVSDVVKVLRRKLSALSSVQFGIEQPNIAGCLLAKNLDILQSLKLQLETDKDDSASQSSRQERMIRPISPRKLFSSFLSSSTGPGTQPPTSPKKDLPSLPLKAPVLAPVASQDTTKPPSRDSRPSSKDQLTPKSTMSMRSMEQMSSPLKKLDDTLSAYLLALQHRKGNIVGRNLKMRASADELAVNELYNSLLEDPNMMVAAAQAPVDVLFAAFEKFLNIAWKEQVGPVLPYPTLQDIQTKAETLFPADFDEYFKSTVGTFSPQNQRAFKSIMKLLADLLDGTGNDSDRGTLTCAFAEVLVTEGNPLDYIALIDRFVDDPDTYFGEPLEDLQKADNAANEHKRARSVNSASVTSNTSSLRRKFGFGVLTRENSKSEQESKVASVWRTLSKSTRVDASPASSISKGTLFRSHSTDVDVRSPPSSRPVSHDGPLMSKPTSSGEDSILSGTGSTHNLGLSTIGEHPSFIPKGPPKKKRRSSLSDLQDIQVSQEKSPAWSPPASRLPPMAQRFNVDKSLPNSPMPSTPSSRDGSGRFGTPSKEPPRSRLPSSFRKENSPGAVRTFDPSQQRPKSSDSKTEEVVITARPTSGIPKFSPKTLSPPKITATTAPSTPARQGLAERPGAGNIVKKSSPLNADKAPKSAAGLSQVSDTGSPTKKLRMQSPQKLRERLQNEHATLAAAQASLQEELSKIGDELTSTPNRNGTITSGSSASQAIRARGSITQPSTLDLTQRVLKMETQLSTQMDDLRTRISDVKSDVASSLAVSENKCKKLDELYREANGENEALYTRFNEELGRVLKAVRGGEGVEELRRKLREGLEEVGKLKRENGRLKRENVGLRAQLSGG